MSKSQNNASNNGVPPNNPPPNANENVPCGPSCFRREVPFHTVIQGSVNGQMFTVEGKGIGDANAGRTRGKWVCTSGRMPLAWASLAATLQGFKCFAQYPNGLTHFYQECMPEGYTQERVTRYQDDGTLKTYHEVSFSKGVVMNKITVQGEGFKPDSPVLNNGIKIMMPSMERTFPFEDGIKSLVHHVFPAKTGNGYAIATQTTVNRPLGENRNTAIPSPHFLQSEIKQFRDADEDGDHIIQEELIKSFHLSMFENEY